MEISSLSFVFGQHGDFFFFFFFYGQQGDFFLDVAFALGFAGAGASGFSFFDPMG